MATNTMVVEQETEHGIGNNSYGAGTQTHPIGEPKPEHIEQQAQHQQEPPTTEASLSVQPKAQIAVVMSSLCACVFVAALDVTIIATALPAIAGNFGSASGYQWVGSAYVLGNTASTPTWGKLSDIWGRKMILLAGITIFFAGSLLCALAPNMAVFLAARAMQGVGGAGLLTLVNIAISDLFSMRDRGLYYGLTSVVWAVAAGVGPVLGGVFTQQASWRWCFWINLPITAVCFLFLVFTMPKDHPGTPILTGLAAIDWTGSLLLVGGTLMLLLGLNFGGVTFPWASATVVNLIVFGVFATFLFVLNEWKLVRYPVMPPRLFRTRSSIASLTVCFFHGCILLGVAYYLPLYFQAVLGVGPLLSGAYLLPFVLSNTFCAAGTGLFIQRTGKYMPLVYPGLVLMVLGVGLFVDFDVQVNWAKLVIYQILVGAGVGMNFEGPLLALQASNDVQDVATATATMGFVRMLASAISAVVGGVVFQNQMAKEAASLPPGSDVLAVIGGGEAAAHVEAISALPSEIQTLARLAFHRSLRTMWIMYVAFAGVAWIAGFFIGSHHLTKELRVSRIGLEVEGANNFTNADGREAL